MSTFLDAAYQVLKDIGHPLSQEDITKEALKRGLLETQGLTPEKTMGSLIYVDIKKKGAASRFIKFSSNRFALNDRYISQPVIPHALSKKKPKANEVPEKKKRESNKITLAHEILDQEIITIQAYLNGRSEKLPSNEKLCDWVIWCYGFGLFSEAAELFNLIDADEVNEWNYERSKKIARLCAIHLGNIND